MKTARNAEMNSAISISSYVIGCLYGEEMNLLKMVDYAFSMSDAIEKWAKPQKTTLLHEYIFAVYTEEQDYLLRKEFPVPVIREMQELFDNYSIIMIWITQ